jgi:Ca2+-transporting ATPase
LSGGFAEILVMLVGPFLGMALPLLPAQILWINLVTHGLVGVSLGAEPAEEGALRAGPRPPDEGVLGDGLWRQVLRVGAVVATVTLALGAWAHETGRPWQTVTFLSLGALQLGVALASRARRGWRGSRWLVVAVVGAAVLQVGAVYLGPLQSLLSTESLGASDLVVVTGLSVLGYVALRLDRAVRDRRR